MIKEAIKEVMRELKTREQEQGPDEPSPGEPSLQPRMEARLGKWKYVLIAVTIAIVVVVGVRIFQTLYKPIKADTDQAVLTVTVDEAKRESVHIHLTLAGTVWAWDPLTIGAEIGGLRIATVDVEEGDIVKKGQVLLTLNSNMIRAQIEKEQARLQRAEINLQKVKQPNRQMDINRIKAVVAQASAVVSQEQANVVRAKANLKNATNNVIRYRSLSKDGAVSALELDARETQVSTCEADVHNSEQRLTAALFAKMQAEENLKLALEGGMKQDVQMAEADIKEIKANLRNLDAQLQQTIIRAPSHGLITKRLAHIGDISVANEDCFQMVRDNRFEVRAQVPEQDLSKLRPGQEVQFKGASGGSKIVGKLREISPMVDPNTRLAMARIDIPFEKGWLPGMFVSGIVDLGEIMSVVVPAPAVVDKDGRKIVYILEGDNKVYGRQVEAGERVGDVVEIRNGLKVGDKVVTTGSGFLKDGDSVRVGSADEASVEAPTHSGDSK